MRLLLLTAIVATAMTGVAWADIDETVTGTIASGADVLGLFGGGSLAGQTFSLTITGNLAGETLVTGTGYVYGYANGAADPLTNALTINGDTYIPTPYATYSALYTPPTFSGAEYDEESLEIIPVERYIELTAVNFGSAGVALPEGPPDPFVSLAAVLAGGSPDVNIFVFNGANGASMGDVLRIEVSTISISTSAVPEPSSILLLFTILPALALVARKRIASRH